MSESFLTVEDINSILRRYAVGSMVHEIDTSNITSEYDFNGIKYDFVEISREGGGFDFDGFHSEYKFTFNVVHSNCQGRYCLLKNDRTEMYSNTDYSYNQLTNGMEIYTDEPSVILCLHIDPFAPKSFWASKMNMGLVDKFLSITLDEVDTEFYPNFYYLSNGEIYKGDKVHRLYRRIMSFMPYELASTQFHGLCKLIKTDFQFNITDNIIIGKVNTVQLGADSEYKPNGSLIGDNPITITVDYNGETSPVEWDSEANDYIFNLDLSDKTSLGKIHITVNVEVNDVINATSTQVVLETSYQEVNSTADFILECGVNGSEIITLSDDITLSSNVEIKHDLQILGEAHTIDLNEYGLILDNNVTCIIEDVDFINGDTAITQNKNTDLTLNNCSFTNCISSEYNNLGSCIYCDVDEESLNNPNDFTTIIIGCTFTNNHNCIFHGGNININNTKYLNNDLDYADKHNTAFLYQTDGNAVITSSVFDIDYISTDLCENEKSIGYGQALIQCGLTANINGATSTELLKDDSLPFTENKSHVFVKYYYPQINSCVYTSPVLNREDKAVCYCVTGENWIWKQNVQVTRASWDTQNEIRKIVWED